MRLGKGEVVSSILTGSTTYAHRQGAFSCGRSPARSSIRNYAARGGDPLVRANGRRRCRATYPRSMEACASCGSLQPCCCQTRVYLWLPIQIDLVVLVRSDVTAVQNTDTVPAIERDRRIAEQDEGAHAVDFNSG